MGLGPAALVKDAMDAVAATWSATAEECLSRQGRTACRPHYLRTPQGESKMAREKRLPLSARAVVAMFMVALATSGAWEAAGKNALQIDRGVCAVLYCR